MGQGGETSRAPRLFPPTFAAEEERNGALFVTLPGMFPAGNGGGGRMLLFLHRRTGAAWAAPGKAGMQAGKNRENDVRHPWRGGLPPQSGPFFRPERGGKNGEGKTGAEKKNSLRALPGKLCVTWGNLIEKYITGQGEGTMWDRGPGINFFTRKRLHKQVVSWLYTCWAMLPSLIFFCFSLMTRRLL